MISIDHRPTIVQVQTFYLDSPEWIATCPCGWHDHRAVRRQLIVDAANSHEWQRHPGRRPAPAPPDPAHGLRSQRQNRAGTELRMDCYCGKGWTGAPSPVRTTMAEHLSAHGGRGAIANVAGQ